jgi:hypothetical protein
MRLNIMTSNVLHKQLVDETNIIYYTSNSLFDHILYLIDNNYFVFADVPTASDNCKCVRESHIDLYDYDMCCSNGITTYKDRSNLSSVMHISNLFLEHNYRASNLKKEDLYIINQNLSKIKKVFFNNYTAQSWGLQNSLVVEYGVPVDQFVPLNSQPKKEVLISASNQAVAGQLQQHIINNLKMQAECVEGLNFADIPYVNKLFNNYKVFVNLSNNMIDSLCAASSGMDVLALAQVDPNDKKLYNVPNIKNYSNVNDIAAAVEARIKNATKNNNANTYIKNNYSFDKFKEEMQGVFDTVKREAHVL